MNNFIHLHTHSDYSLRDGAQTVAQIVSKAQELNMPAVALTDHGMAGGILQLKKECLAKGIKYIPGIEFYVAPENHLTKEKVNNHTKTSYHLTVLAKNYEGLKNIFRLSSVAWTEGLYYKPRISNELLEKHKEGLIVLSGCSSSRLSVYLMEERYKEALEYTKYMKELFKDDFYIEIQNHGIVWQIPLKEGLIAIADQLKLPVVITQDSHYQNKEEAGLHSHICKLSSGDLEFASDQSYFKTRWEMEQMFPVSQHKYLDNTLEIANKINCEWDYSKTIWPSYPLKKETAEEELRELCWQKFELLFGPGTKQYIDRLEEELNTIISMGFATYFLIVQDFINWAKNNNILIGPGRGSGCGSLVCYCLGITEVDPIKYNLLFSRFLNIHRVNLPDLDIDIAEDKRQELIDYVAKKYGSDRISQIGTYGVFKPRSALRAFARTCGYPVEVGERLANLVPADIAGKQLPFKEVIKLESAFANVEEQHVLELVSKAEGLKNQAGVHAAGVVLADRPINEVTPLFVGRTGKIASQFDMHDIEEIGLVKFDFLGLKNLTVIADTISLIKQNYNIDINLLGLEDGDLDTYKLFERGDLDGIFQFETSSGFKELCIQVRPKNIEDLAIITSLFRPGPTSVGLLQAYVERRKGEPFEYEIPELQPILEPSLGVLCLQEQIMQICIDLAGYSAPESDNMRRIVGKKIPEEMAKEKEKFINGCINYKNISKDKAEKLFNDIEGFALYGFNWSHSCAYSFISYRTAWLKAHYPLEFYTALLNSSLGDVDDLVKYSFAIREKQIPLIPPDINESDIIFKINNKAIIFGLAGIKGLGDKACEHLISVRPKEGFKDLSELVKLKVNKSVLVALAESGALESISDIPRHQLVVHIPLLINYYNKTINWEEQKVAREIRDKEILEAVADGRKPPRKLPKLKPKPEYPEIVDTGNLSKQERLEMEKKTLGFYFTGHPLDNYPGVLSLAKYNIEDIKNGLVPNKQNVTLPVVISSITKKLSKKNKEPYGILIIEDQSGRIETTMFSKTWRIYESKIEEGLVALVKGWVRTQIQDEGSPIIRLSIQEIKNITETERMIDLELLLKDGTQIIFKPTSNIYIDKYYQAKAYINNLQRMR